MFVHCIPDFPGMIDIIMSVAVPQQVGGGEMTPAQPIYGGPPGGTGTPDMTQYSSGLQPGWEAKWVTMKMVTIHESKIFSI